MTYLAFSPDGSKVVSASLDNTTRLWSADPHEQTAPGEGHETPITCTAVAPDGSTVVTGSADGHACVWGFGTGELLTVLEGHTDGITRVAYSPSGALMRALRPAMRSLQRSSRVGLLKSK